MTTDLVKDLCAKVLAQTPDVTQGRIAATVDQFLGLYPALEPEREGIIRYLQANFSVFLDDYRILEDPKTRPEPWVKARRASGGLPWKFWHRYRLFLEKKIAAPTLNQTDNLTDDILDRLVNPQTPGPWNRRGMVVGQVQSGKTGNYIGLINKAVDAGYKLVIVLAGVHDSLRAQTQLRVDEGFLGYDSRTATNFFKAHNRIGVGNYDRNLPAQPLTTSHLDGDFRKPTAQTSHNLKGTDPIVLVVKKNGAILRNLIQWLAGWGDTQPDGKKLIERVPQFLIDDEADNASINVSKDKISTINGYIRALLALFEQSAYVGYTATPFANIYIPILPEEVAKGLNEKLKNFEFSVGQDLFPSDFIVNLPAPSNYIGPTKLFGLPAAARSENAEEPLPLVINLTDPARFGADYVHFVPDKHKKDDALPTALPASLRYAIRCFLLVGAARQARGQLAHQSMLIHVTRFIRWMDAAARLVDEELKQAQRQIEFNQGAIRAELEGLWRTEFEPVTATIRAMAQADPNAYQDPDLRPLTWAEVEPFLFGAVAGIEVRAIHGEKNVAGLSYRNISPLDYDLAEKETPPRYLSVIAVGGDKLSRGLTLEGLSVSYYLRASKMYDTLMQMGRWFGYRPGYVDLCRLFTSGELIKWYEFITLASEELRRDFDDMWLLNRTPCDYGLKIRAHPDVLKITAINKFRYKKEVELSYSAELEQAHRLPMQEKLFIHNFKALTALIGQLDEPVTPPNAKSAGRPNVVWRSDAYTICQFLTNYRIGSEVMNPALMVAYIEAQNERGNLTDWTVVLISVA
ncbi:MAG: Z1 domain-containing protein, partial [Cytophagaceae bacterium]|nr:Z1 domain-containing protein [Cytophagaceae bacterium]